MEDQQATNIERGIVPNRQRRQVTDEERLLRNERRRNQYRARQQHVDPEAMDVDASQNHFTTRSNIMSEEQRAIERERCRVRNMNRRENMTDEERLLLNERRRKEYQARQQNVESVTMNVVTSQSRFAARRNRMTEEQRATETERLRVRDRQRQQNLTAEERLLLNERSRIDYRSRKHLASSSTSNADTTLFEHVMQQHVQQEVERIVGHGSALSMNNTAGFLELGPDHRAPLHTRYEDMVEFDEQVDRFEDVQDDSHQEDLQEGQAENPQSNRANINRNRRTPLPNRGFHNAARGFIDELSLPPLQLNNISSCNHCGAKLFPHETNQFCCLNGKVKLPDIPVPPELMLLYTVQSELGAYFRQNIRSLNHVFAFTSIGVRIDHNTANSKKGIYTYRAQGTMYHKIGSLIPEPSDRPRFLQMYVYDTEHELENRLKEQQFAAKKNKGKEHEQEPPDREEPLNREVLAILKAMLDGYNPYVRVIRQISQATDLHDVRLHIKEQPTFRRTYNMPTSPQVAAVLVGGEEPSEVLPRDIIIQTNSGNLLNVPDTACFYDPLQYPLLHPYGSFGWDLTIFSSNETRISVRAYYAYMLQIRESHDSILLRGEKLLQQYVVDNYVKISTMQLRWVRDNQRIFHADWYSGVLDAMDSNTSDLGQRVILPPSYTGSPRDMHQRYHDAMALVQKYGKPDLFITMTCNPNWVEIQRELKPGQQAHHRPDLTTRVFHSKFEELKVDLFTKGVLGKVAAHVHVIEFQKRGLPHAHILIILHERDKLRSPDDYDRVVRAEIPDEKVEPELYASVLKHMIHMPCALSTDSVCKKDGKCKKRFPKQFAAETLEGQDSYPVYRRRDDGRAITLANGKVVNNSWVVPYNPWLLKKYDFHINVEICSSVHSVKYLYKYVWKGVDHVSMELSSEKHDEDEIKQFVDARWVCPQEALWRIYKYQMNKVHPPVMSLQVHLKDRQKIILPVGNTVRDVLRRERASRTQLTEYFKTNQEDEFARTLLYKEFPEHYVWDKPLKQWQRRRRNNKVVGRVNVFSTRSESYHLRLLLMNIRGAKSFEDFLKVGDQTFSNYKEVAQHLCLLESDTPIRDTLLEAVQVEMPCSLRRLFCMLLDLCNPTGVRDLWDEFFPYMIEDHCQSNTETGAINLLLREIRSVLGEKLMATYKLPPITEDMGASGSNELVSEEFRIPVSPEDLSSIDMLNADQKYAFDRVVNSVRRGEKCIFFIDGPGGSGKTFLYRAILAKLRSERRIAIATATSGIAATMMPGGRTAHSRFKIPVPAYSTSTCNIIAEEPLADFLRKADLIIWDEATMANRYAFEALDTTLRALTKVELPFGGKIMLLGGDFRQVLPVIEHGTRAQNINACLTNAKFWKDVKVIRLKENMRSRFDPRFSEFLLRIGDGTEPYVMDDMVKLPDDIVMKWEGEQSVDKLIDEVFLELGMNASNKTYMSQRALITPKNDIVEKLNQKVINIFPGDEVVYHSFDMAQNDPHNLWTEDFLNTIAPGGLPPHRLILKIGAPIILLRNLDPSYGLCNGTRLLCRGLYRNFIDAEIVTGSCSGLRVLIPRIPMEPPKEVILPFKFVRKQFPIRAGFALTINKAQGQTIPHVGIYLPEPVFSHGQLYVALSRGVSKTTTKVLVKDGVLPNISGTCTKNVVFQDVLRSSDIAERYL